MSGICGAVLNEATAPDVLEMARTLEAGGSRQAVAVSPGRAALGAQGFPGRRSGVARLDVHGEVLALAFHGSLYESESFPTSETPRDDLPRSILRLYEKEGVDFLQRLTGDFAVAIWDGRSQELLLATDRFRVHPLFYYSDPHKLVFGSSMRSILAFPGGIEPTLEPAAVVDVVASSFIPTPRTIFREVTKLPSGHLLRYRDGRVALSRYWDVDFLQQRTASEPSLAKILRQTFSDAVSSRLSLDLPSSRVGTSLSGGIDSSTLTGVMARQANSRVQSFSIGFKEEDFDEMSYARIAARAFHAEHHEYCVTPEDTVEAIPILVRHFDEPYANASAVPTYYCAKLAKDHGVQILYAGDGGDELFAGNERYAAQKLFEYYERIPSWVREPILKPVVFFLADRSGVSLLQKGRKYIEKASLTSADRLSSYSFLRLVEMSEFFEDGFLERVGQDYDPYGMTGYYHAHAPARSELDRQLYADLQLTITDNDLFKVTRMTEAAGVCVRFPFLDHRLAEFAASVPAGIKMRGRTIRSFFKNAYADLLPDQILTKTKHGFGLPIPLWLRTDKRLNEMMHDLVLGKRARERGFFKRKAVEDLVERHKTDETSFYGAVLWNLMMLELWHREYVS